MFPAAIRPTATPPSTLSAQKYSFRTRNLLDAHLLASIISLGPQDNVEVTNLDRSSESRSRCAISNYGCRGCAPERGPTVRDQKRQYQ